MQDEVRRASIVPVAAGKKGLVDGTAARFRIGSQAPVGALASALHPPANREDPVGPDHVRHQGRCRPMARKSSPLPPRSLSLPPSPQMMSCPFVPTRSSSPSVPRITFGPPVTHGPELTDVLCARVSVEAPTNMLTLTAAASVSRNSREPKPIDVATPQGKEKWYLLSAT